MNESDSASMTATSPIVDEVVSNQKPEDLAGDVWVGFDLGGTKMYAVVFDSDLKPLGKAR